MCFRHFLLGEKQKNFTQGAQLYESCMAKMYKKEKKISMFERMRTFLNNVVKICYIWYTFTRDSLWCTQAINFQEER